MATRNTATAAAPKAPRTRAPRQPKVVAPPAVLNVGAPAPTRSIWKFTLQLGLLGIPCSLYSSSEDIAVHRNRVTRDQFHLVGNAYYDKETGETVEFANITTAIEVDGKLIEITDEEISAAVGLGAGESASAEIIAVQSKNLLGAYVPSTRYQVRTQQPKKGANLRADQAFLVLLEALKRTETFAVVRFSYRGRPRYAALTPEGDWTTLCFTGEIRERRPLPVAEIDEESVKLMNALLLSKVSIEPLTLVDEASVKVAEYAAAKARAIAEGSVTVTSAAKAAAAPIADLNDLLKQALGSAA